MEQVKYDTLEPQVILEMTVTRPTGGETRYELREADASAAKVYRMASMAGVEMEMGDGETKVIKHIQGIAAVESLLVSECLFECIGPETDKDGNPKAGAPDRWRKVGLLTLTKWKQPVVKMLHDRCKAASELDERDDLPALLKQRAALQKRIDKLEANLPNAERASGETTSASPTS